MTGAIAGNIGGAVLEAFSLALLIPFLNTLFDQPPINVGGGALSALLRGTVGSMLDPSDKMGSLRNVILIVLAIVILKNLLVWLAGQLGASVQELVTRDLRNALYAHITQLPLSFFTRTKTGQILSRVITDTAETRLILTQIVQSSLQNGALVLSYIAFLFLISWKMTLVAMILLPLLAIVLQPMLRKLRAGNRRRGNQHGEMTSVVQETVSGIRLVKSFGAEEIEQTRFSVASNRYASSTIRLTRLSFLASPVTEALGTAIAVALLWFGAREVLVVRAMSGGDLIAFLLYALRLLQPLKQLSQLPTTAQVSLAAADRLFEILDSPSEAQEDAGTRNVAEFKRDIRFDNVSFAYDDEPVLANVSLTARKGEVIALVGPSGAGKSTLVDLIPRFYEVRSGRILLDDVDVREIRLPALRALTGVVSQDTVLFNDNVRNNIGYGADRSYSDQEIEAAARAANAHPFIAAMPDGYSTMLGERGTRLSGGQRQRLAIARALLSDPPILILDEATSALDTESERLVQEAVDRLLRGRTVFVIAHRLSTIVHADQILFLDRGEIVERGTHAELLVARGAYHRLYSMQFGSVGIVSDSMVSSAV
ncbi:MAG: ATP-binding cassette domain-containing protein [Gemmatimonadaceae bacterium]|nr:ATP-binding cassette domain-containing protein [Gemmatimonadaceae bacterium]MDQ3243488.1 ABC transporter transmembrane domain-containing protein [Gemmatimonadota bacterium]